MRAVVLCAGYGTRLGSLTSEIPKPMLYIAGKPLLEYILMHLKNQGLKQIAVNLHFKPEQIMDYFGSGEKLGIEIHYFREPILLGTAGALKNMEEFLKDQPSFLVQYGDVLTDQDLSALVQFHRQKNSEATLLLHQRSNSNSMVALDEDQRIVEFLERPSEEQKQGRTSKWVNSGICVCGPKFLDWIPPGKVSDIPKDIIVPRVKTNRFFGFPLSGYRCAIDSPDRYAQAGRDVVEGKLHV